MMKKAKVKLSKRHSILQVDSPYSPFICVESLLLRVILFVQNSNHHSKREIHLSIHKDESNKNASGPFTITKQHQNSIHSSAKKQMEDETGRFIIRMLNKGSTTKH